MKSGFRLSVRKMPAHIPQLLGLVLLLAVGVCFFITLFTIVTRYETSADKYFVDNAYAQMTLYGSFVERDVDALSEDSRVVCAQGRTVLDCRVGERIFRVVSLSDGINVPHIYEGRLPVNASECVLLRRSADAMGLIIGDSLSIGARTLAITGLAASPEYVYLSQNERTVMAYPNRFGVLFVAKEFFPDGYNEIVMLTGDDFPGDSQMNGLYRAVSQKDQLNYIMYRRDLGEIRSFAYIFPFVFALLIAVVIFVMLSRTIQKDRKQIGAMKALGFPDGKIIAIYLLQHCFAALAGALAGCGLAVLITDFIIGIFSSMFEVPALSFAFYPGFWAGAVLASILLCALSALIALVRVLPLMPAIALRPRAPKGGRRILLERAEFAWKRLSFNTRYAVKNAFRNKGRFFAVVLGMSGSCALLAFSLGFYDSIGHTQDKYFYEFANYDVIVSCEPLPLSIGHPALELLDSGFKALTLPVWIRDENYHLAIVEHGFDMVALPAAALSDGLIIPEYYAHEWGIGIGDTINVNGYAAAVSAVVPQYLGLTLYTGFDYIDSLADSIPAANNTTYNAFSNTIYNTIYGRCADLPALTGYLTANGIEYTTIGDDKTSFDTVMESMSVLIWFMIACAIVLGIAVLYCVGLINLSAREYEYMFMGVMGYPHKSILAAHIKEALLQLMIAIPPGFLLGNLLLEIVKGEFSGSSYVIAASIYPQSYVVSALSIIGVTALMVLVASRHIDRLDIVEGLKARDE